MQIWAESGKSALPICNYSQILYQFLTFTQNLKRSPRILSEEKSPFYVNWLNIIGVAFMPISMITGYISGLVFKLEGWIAPYPIGIFHTLVFVLVFFVVVIASYIILKKQTK